MDSLVTTQWLAEQMGAADLRIVDATYFLPEHKRDAAMEFGAAHIPGAVFLDLATLADAANPLPAMLPPAGQFAARMGVLGIAGDDRIVVYDNSPLHSAARAWWMLRTFGARNVAILDGSFARWRSEGRSIASGPETPTPATFTAHADLSGVRGLERMRANLDAPVEQVVDARSAARFAGAEAEARPNTEAGHIPGSKNIPYGSVLDADGRWKSPGALRAIFADAGVDPGRPLVATCGSGITGASLVFAAHLLGRDAALYDGSWSEWGAEPSTPKEKGTR